MLEFAKNIRTITGLDDNELRKSLKQFGWHKEFPAIVDENDVVLVGHRRLRLAKQLDIDPVIKKLTLGKGDEADAERLKLALISNIGSQPLTREDRKRIAEHLYGQREWTIEKIAEALDVGKSTVARDLEGFSHSGKTSRPQGGRPKGSKPRSQRQPQAVEREEKVAAFRDAGLSANEIAEKVGLGLRAVHQALEHVDIKREAEPDIDRSDLSMSAQQKYDAAVRQKMRQLDATFEKRVMDDVQRRIDEIVLPYWKEQIKQAKELYGRRKGLMNKDTFNTIRRGLHPDSRQSISDKKLGEAFDAFMALEKFLLDEKNSPTEFGDLPSSLAEWDKMRAKRPTKQPANSSTIRPR
jgi:ParB-like chromosome segregation protein Spo0J